MLALYVRRGDLALPDSQEVQATAESLLAGREFAVESDDVLALAATSGRSAYDCEFVAVARRLALPLVTADRQVLASFPEVAVALASYGAA